jgi:myosin heavy subunit
VHKDHERLIDEKLHLRTEFGIRHFAGAVTYHADRFVERNTDKVPEDLLSTAAKSSNDLIGTEFESLIAAESHDDDAPGARRKKSINKTVLQKFRGQLQSLLLNMEGTKTRYIRCIKPNDNMAPKMTDHYTTMRQLECAGLVTAITISHESFPNKLAHEAIKDRFNFLMTKQDHDYMRDIPIKDAVHYMLTNLLYAMLEEHPNGSVTLPFACGTTRVYFRAGALEHLETQRLDYYTQRVVIIQAWTRKLQGEARLKEVRAAVVKIQSTARGRLDWKRYREQKMASVTIASWFRGRQATKLIQGMRKERAATVLQSRFRAKSKRYALRRWKRATVIIQRAVKTKVKRTSFTAELAIAVEEARMDTKLLGLKEKVSLASDSVSTARLTASPSTVKGRQVNDELLGEIEKYVSKGCVHTTNCQLLVLALTHFFDNSMFEYLRKEIFMLRGKNDDLKGELIDAENDKRELLSHAESAEAASSSRLRVSMLTKSNAALMSGVLEHKHEAAQQRKEIRTLSSIQEEHVASVKVDFESVLKERDSEIRNPAHHQTRQEFVRCREELVERPDRQNGIRTSGRSAPPQG